MNPIRLIALMLPLAISELVLGSDPNAPATADGSVTTVKPRRGNPFPQYPASLMEKHLEGTVLLEVSVDTEGKVSSIKALKSADPAFSEAAIVAVRRWIFQPATKDGQPIAAKYRVPISFRFGTGMPTPSRSNPEKQADSAPGSTATDPNPGTKPESNPR